MNAQSRRYLSRMLAVALGAGLTVAVVTGCESIAEITASVGELTGDLTKEQAESIRKVGKTADKFFAEITPENEYYIGRSVGATLLGKFGVYESAAATEYINTLGQAIAAVSDMPETFRGYRFLIMNTDEINAFAAPGGFIFVSRGLLRLCHDEDELAAVLAHEVGHIQLRHAVRAIKSSRGQEALLTTVTEAGKSFSDQQTRELTLGFGDTVNDVTKTLWNSGYARSQEREADKVAVTLLCRLGYNPRALVSMLKNMGDHTKPGDKGFAATHPPPSARIADIEKSLVNLAVPGQPPPVRKARFAASMTGV